VRAIGLPSFPAYPSNHSRSSPRRPRCSDAFFPAERARLDAMAEEGGISRLYGGIHYRFDVEAGLALGRRWRRGRSPRRRSAPRPDASPR
jgi:hypothetical protein